MSSVKETGFFAWQAEWQGRSDPPRQWYGRPYAIRHREDYERQFAAADGARAIGEATPYYLFVPGVPERIAATVPSARLIAILREPVSRAFSNWTALHAEGRDRRSFEDAVADELAKLDRPVAPGEIAHLRTGLYHRHLQRFLGHFPREQMLVLLQDDLAASVEATMREVFRFLQVDASAPVDASVRHNPTGVPRNAAIDRLTGKNALTAALKQHLPPAIRDPLYRLAMRLRAGNRERRAHAARAAIGARGSVSWRDRGPGGASRPRPLGMAGPDTQAIRSGLGG